MSAGSTITRRSFIIGLVLCGCATLSTIFVSMNMNGRFQHRNESINEQLGIVERRSWTYDGVETQFYVFQNRILFASSLKALIGLDILKPSQVYMFLRVATCYAAFYSIWCLLILVAQASIRTAAAGIGMLAYTLIYTCNWPWEHPTDYPDVLFMAMFIWFTLRKFRILALLLAIVASANRESSPALGILWLFMHGWVGRKPIIVEIAFATTLSILGTLAVFGLRYCMTPDNAVNAQAAHVQDVAGFTNFMRHYISLVNSPSPFAWPILIIAMFTPVCLWIATSTQLQDITTVRLLAATAIITVATSFFCNIMEMRAFIPTAVWLIFIAVRCDSTPATLEGPRDSTPADPLLDPRLLPKNLRQSS